jgi:hypothetical protein
VGTIPVTILLRYVDQIVEKHGVTNAEYIVGVAARRIFGVRGQTSVTPQIAERIVIAGRWSGSLVRRPGLRRFWFACLPSDTLNVNAGKASQARYAAAKREAARRGGEELIAA